MKKKLFLGLLAAAAVSFTACQKDEVLNEVQQDNAIGFGTYVGRDAQTKALEATGETIKDGFGVFAYYTGNTDYPESPETNTTYAPSFMNNEKVWVKSGTNFTYENTKYWPGNNSNHKVSFFAYAPYTEITTLPPTTNITAFGTTGTDVLAGKGDPTLTFKVAGTVYQQVDLLYATPVKNRWNGDISANPQTYTDQKVKFTFNHALSRIGFKVKTARTDYKITIKDITVSGKFYTSGTLNLNSGDWTNRSVAKDNNSNEIATNYTVEAFNNKATDLRNTNGLDITKDGYYVMVIPTTLNTDENKLEVTVTYSYAYKVSDNEYTDYVDNNNATGSVKVNFEKGKAYTLVMELDPLSPIVFAQPEVNPWVAAGSTPTDVNVTVTTPANNN